MADEHGQHSDSIKNLFQSLRDLADVIRLLDGRVRVLEEKRIEAEGKLSTLLSNTELQLGRVVSDAESEKNTRRDVNRALTDKLDKITTTIDGKMDNITNAINGKFEKVKEAQDRINLKIAYWSGGLAVLYILGQVALKFWK